MPPACLVPEAVADMGSLALSLDWWWHTRQHPENLSGARSPSDLIRKTPPNKAVSCTCRVQSPLARFYFPISSCPTKEH